MRSERLTCAPDSPACRRSAIPSAARRRPRLDGHLGDYAALGLLDALDNRSGNLDALVLAREQREGRLGRYLIERRREIALEVVLSPALRAVDDDHAAARGERHRRQ